MTAPFGLRFAPGTAADVAARVLRPRAPGAGTGLVATPNVDHIICLRRQPDFARAYARAEIVLCDGAPLRAYAWLCGCPVRRVTGCDLAAAVLEGCDARQRPFFVVDTKATEAAVRVWAAARGLAGQTAIHVAPRGFDRDPQHGHGLAQAVRAHAATILLMGIGAPRSEVFADSWREQLPDCWVLCIGQGVKTALGLVARAPAALRLAQIEFVWRICQEPRRLAGRYARGAVLFPVAIIEDCLGYFPRLGTDLP
jgi:N-acetylglucosaminyldiphosphoundecaprenol N-acetyl-beta-D-mannosaminyltransferase